MGMFHFTIKQNDGSESDDVQGFFSATDLKDSGPELTFKDDSTDLNLTFLHDADNSLCVHFIYSSTKTNFSGNGIICEKK